MMPDVVTEAWRVFNMLFAIVLWIILIRRMHANRAQYTLVTEDAVNALFVWTTAAGVGSLEQIVAEVDFGIRIPLTTLALLFTARMVYRRIKGVTI